MDTGIRFGKRRLLPVIGVLALATAQAAHAQEPREDIAELRRLLAEQAERIDRQEAQIARQELEIAELRAEIKADLALLDADDIAVYRGAGFQAGAPTADPADEPLPADEPVGQAPPPSEERKAAVAAVPQDQGVLTRRGQIVLEPSFQYVNSANDRLVFRGFELIPGIQIGVIEASRARRDSLIGTFAARYGLTNRLEIEGRVPVLYRNDSIRVTQQRDEGIVREINLSETDIGDAELSLRYQLNSQRGQRPIWIAGLRVKSDTGRGPFDIGYDEFGVATGLTTGSGFWAVQPSISMLLPSDPVVIFGGVNYLYHIGRDIDRAVGGAQIGHVDPGDSISGSIGFGFALNPRFSYSMGYRHSYIMPSKTEIGGSIERSDRLQVGSFNVGMSYRLTPRVTANVSFEIGVTEDAPDLGVTLRFPISF